MLIPNAVHHRRTYFITDTSASGGNIHELQVEALSMALSAENKRALKDAADVVGQRDDSRKHTVRINLFDQANMINNVMRAWSPMLIVPLWPCSRYLLG